MSEPRMIPADEAKQLRENTKNLGPWWPEYDDDEEQWDINWENHLSNFSVTSQIGHAHGEGTARLFAAAPDLAHTVIEQAAQIERVREGLEALRDYYIDREARSRERLESVTDERKQSHLARFTHNHKRTHQAISRILEGNNDE